MISDKGPGGWVMEQYIVRAGWVVPERIYRRLRGEIGPERLRDLESDSAAFRAAAEALGRRLESERVERQRRQWRERLEKLKVRSA